MSSLTEILQIGTVAISIPASVWAVIQIKDRFRRSQQEPLDAGAKTGAPAVTLETAKVIRKITFMFVLALAGLAGFGVMSFEMMTTQPQLDFSFRLGPPAPAWEACFLLMPLSGIGMSWVFLSFLDLVYLIDPTQFGKPYSSRSRFAISCVVFFLGMFWPWSLYLLK